MTIPASLTLSAPAGEKAELPSCGCFAAKGSCIRRLKAEDASILAAHLKRLDPETRRLRFGEMVSDPSLAKHASVSLSEDAVAKGLFVDGVLRGLGELRFLSPSRDEAEATFSVEPDFQRRGHGAQLFESLLEAARERSVRRLVVARLHESERMRHAALRSGAELSFPSAEPMAVDANGASEPPEPPVGATFPYALLDWPQERKAPILDAVRRIASVFNPFPARI